MEKSKERINGGIGVPDRPPIIVEPTSTIAPPSGVPYSNPAGSEYPVLALNDFHFESDAPEEQIRGILQGIKSCGFNGTIWDSRGHEKVHPQWMTHIVNYYRIAKSLGLPTIRILSNLPPVVTQKYTQTVPKKPEGFEYVSIDSNGNRFTMQDYADILDMSIDNSNLWGFKLKDEPGFDLWGYKGPVAPVGTVDICAVYRTYLMHTNGHVGFFTLAVTTSEGTIGKDLANNKVLDNYEKYAAYLKAFKDKFNPPLLTVDLYPVLKNYDDKNPHLKVRSDYYPYMETIARFSTEHNLPFWMFILSTQMDIYYEGTEKTRVEHPLPTEGILRFQAMTAIAYGFQGVVFWTYAAYNTKNGGEMFHESLIDNNGSFTQVWYNSKAVIPEIKSYGKELLNAKFQEAKHVYGTLRVGEFKDTERLTSPIGCISNATAQGKGFVITRLTKGKQNYLAIVSHDPFDSQSITLTIASGYDWEEVGRPEGAAEKSQGDVDSILQSGMMIQRTLKPGGMILIRY